MGVPRKTLSDTDPKVQMSIVIPYHTAEHLDDLARVIGNRSLAQTIEYLIETGWESLEEHTPQRAFSVVGPHRRRGRPDKRSRYLSMGEVRDREKDGTE